MVGPGFFATLGIPVRRGRLLNETDHVDAPPTVVIDEEMARRYWPGEDPIGKRIRFSRNDAPWHVIVGVVADVKFDGLGVSNPTYYHYQEQTASWADFHGRTMTVLIRTHADPMTATVPLRATVDSLDPNVPIVRLQSMDDILAASVARPRFLMTLLGLFAGIALVLGAIGVYGIMSHGVTERIHEIGIRMALGAGGGTVTRMVIRQGMIPALLGAGVGLVAAMGSSRILSGFLFNVSTTDLSTYFAVSMVMVSVGFIASYIPARRASRVDPLIALRVE
jgi:predicted permease